MKKLKVLVVALFVTIFISGCIGVDPKTGNYGMKIPMNLLNEQVKREFPLDQKMQYGTLHLSDASLGSSKSQDKAEIKVAFNFSNFLIPSGIHGALALTSGVRYDAESKNLYLKNPMLDKLELQDSSLAKMLTPGIKAEIFKIVAEVVTKYPVYNLQNSAGMASGFIKDITIKDSDLYLNFGL
jgi:hypothetical protein